MRMLKRWWRDEATQGEVLVCAVLFWVVAFLIGY